MEPLQEHIHLGGWHHLFNSHRLFFILSDKAATGIRLVSSDSIINYSAGRVEVFYDGEWGTICDDHPIDGANGHDNNNAANVICRMLGFTHGIVKNQAYFGEGNGRIWLDEVNCTGTEESLFDCSHHPWGFHDCYNNEDLGVVCRNGEQTIT